MFNLAAKARPYFGAVVLTTGLLSVAGIYSAARMPSSIYPEVTFPRIAIIANKPGYDLRTMELQVTLPLEQSVSSVIGAAQVRSKTIRGASELSIDFVPGTDMIRAEQQTWNRISSIRSQLPPDVELIVERVTPSFFPMINLVLTGGENSSQLRDYAYYTLAPRIKNIPDVLYANVAGGSLREIEVEPRPDDLLAAGLSAADLADQIGKLHQLQPVGRVEQQPFSYQLIVDTQVKSAWKIEDLIITTKNNQPLKVKDVATVRIHHQDRVSSVGYQGKDAVVLTIFRRVGGNSVNISRDLEKLLKDQPPPRNIQATIVYDQSMFITTAVNNVRDAIIVGGFFSILILFAFLRSWRATLISALAIPTTLAITFLILYWIGETFNLMSLGGLAVAIGLIIDDTVVVVENIARHLAQKSHGTHVEGVNQQALDPVTAASQEITGAVVGSTLTTVLVFVPLAFIVGVYGQFFASLSWSLSIAVLVSMVISLTLIPVCAAKFLAGRPMPEPGRVYHFFEHLYERMLSLALRVPWLTLGVSVAAAMIGVVLVTGIPNYFAKKEKDKPRPEPLVKGLETGLMPAMDEGAFILDYWAPSGTPLDRTEQIAHDLERVLSENPDVASYVRRTGSENGLFATQSFRGDIQIVLRPAEDDPISRIRKAQRPPLEDIEKELKNLGKEQFNKKYGRLPANAKEDAAAVQLGKKELNKKYRRRPASEIMKEVEKEVRELYSEHQLVVETVPIIEDELNDMSGANRPLEIKLFGRDYATLGELAEKVGKMLEERGKGRGFKDPKSNVYAGNPDLKIEVDGAFAARGLTTDQVARQLKAMYVGQVATQVRESAVRITDVRVRYPDEMRFGREGFDPERLNAQLILLPDALTTAPPTGPAGFTPLLGPSRAVPVATVAKVTPIRTPQEEMRENLQPVLIVTSEVNESEASLGSVAQDVRDWMAELEEKGEIPQGYHWDLGGNVTRQTDAFRSLTIAMVVAVLLVFIMLAFQFRSVVLPLLIFLTQPLSLVSGLLALWISSFWISNAQLNVSSYMGMILLVGLDMKNGILLVEYIQQLRKEGMELRPALLQAGRTRFRPILMTSLAAILGMLPLAFGIGPGAQMQQPLAIVVIGGLTANMLFTRVVIPVGYLVLERKGKGAPLPVVVRAETPLPVVRS
jgi:multidrug efflux pump subunit AcrB